MCDKEEKKRDDPKGSAVAYILNRLYIHIYRVLLGHLQTKSTREERVLKWVTRVIENDDDDDCSHRC
jgi:hypothetical protein